MSSITTDIDEAILDTVENRTLRSSSYFRKLPSVGPKAFYVIDYVGREREYGMIEAQQSVLKLVKQGLLIKMPERRLLVSNEGVELLRKRGDF